MKRTICYKTWTFFFLLWFCLHFDSVTPYCILGFGICHRKEVLMTFPYFFLDYLKICDQWTLSCCEGWVDYNGDKASMKSLLNFDPPTFSKLFLRFFVQLKTECLEYLVKSQSIITILYSIYPNVIFFSKWKLLVKMKRKNAQKYLD